MRYLSNYYRVLPLGHFCHLPFRSIRRLSDLAIFSLRYPTQLLSPRFAFCMLLQGITCLHPASAARQVVRV